jgi:hypothetical protein
MKEKEYINLNWFSFYVGIKLLKSLPFSTKSLPMINNTGNKVRLSRVCINIIAVKNKMYYIIRMFVCSLSYPADKAHAPYIRIFSSVACPSRSYFSMYHIMILGKKVLNIKCVFNFFNNCCLRHLILTRKQREFTNVHKS